jgi:hypothetical protein
VLKAIQTGVMSHFAPELTSNYAKAQFAFSMILFGVATRDYDTAVPDLIEHNQTLRALLAKTDAALTDVNTAAADDARVAIAAAPPIAPSLRLSDLRAENEALRAIIAGMAPIIEPAADDPALAALAGVRAEIFDYLKADAKKRTVPILNA